MKTGKTKQRRRNLLGFLKRGARKAGKEDIEPVIERDNGRELKLIQKKDEEVAFGRAGSKEKTAQVLSRSSFEKFAYGTFSSRVPKVRRYRERFEQSGIPIIFESYISTAALASILVVVPATIVSFVFLSLVFRSALPFAVLESIGIGIAGSAVSFLLWIAYPLQRRRNFKANLEAQLPYSFGILGVLSAAGISIERMFERIALSDSNPVLASLARRFIRDIKIFGLDTESALKEVARHSPSPSFAKMLESVAVSFRTTGSVHDLIMFESSRLLAEKSDKLKKRVGDLALMAELYITLVVVGPIIFIVMLSILQLLPYSGSLPSIPAINALVFVGIPVVSVGFVLMLDSLVSRI